MSFKMVKIGTNLFAPEWFDLDRSEKTMFPGKVDWDKTPTEWKKLLLATKSPAEWDAMCVRIVKTYGDYPSWWRVEIIEQDVQLRAHDNWHTEE